ncbi:MAG TPA: hypothetical protein GX733_04660 [Tissierellia bacterium]|nr:hypothetical protein [Tissierellia bacterium]
MMRNGNVDPLDSQRDILYNIAQDQFDRDSQYKSRRMRAVPSQNLPMAR